jgi:hypothetical protein
MTQPIMFPCCPQKMDQGQTVTSEYSWRSPPRMDSLQMASLFLLASWQLALGAALLSARKPQLS